MFQGQDWVYAYVYVLVDVIFDIVHNSREGAIHYSSGYHFAFGGKNVMLT
jgi:hypothetical protein